MLAFAFVFKHRDRADGDDAEMGADDHPDVLHADAELGRDDHPDVLCADAELGRDDHRDRAAAPRQRPPTRQRPPPLVLRADSDSEMGADHRDRAAASGVPRRGRGRLRRHAHGEGGHDCVATTGPPPHADFGAFQLQNITSVGNNFSVFPEFVPT